MKKLLILTILLICTLAFSVAVPEVYAQDAPKTYGVERVIDCKTLKLSNGETVHLIGIDCIVSNDKANRDAVRTGHDAASYLEMFIAGFDVLLEFDVEEKDEEERLLAYVYVQPAVGLISHSFNPKWQRIAGDEYYFLNAVMIQAGYALPKTVPPNVKHDALFKELYREVRENRKGRK